MSCGFCSKFTNLCKSANYKLGIVLIQLLTKLCFYRKCPPDIFMINLLCISSSCSTWCLQEGIANRSCVFNRLQLLRKKQKPVIHQGLPWHGKMTWHITSEDTIIYLYCLQMYYPASFTFMDVKEREYTVYINVISTWCKKIDPVYALEMIF